MAQTMTPEASPYAKIPLVKPPGPLDPTLAPNVPPESVPPGPTPLPQMQPTQTIIERGGSSMTGNLVGKDTYADLVDRINARQLDSLQAQKAGIDSQQNEITRIKGEELPVDLSALMSLSDNWYGGNMAKNYKAPQSKEDKQKFVSELENALQKSKGALSKDELDLLKTQLTAQEAKDNLIYKTDALKAMQEEKDKAAKLAKETAAQEKKDKLQEKKDHENDVLRERLGKATEPFAGIFENVKQLSNILDEYPEGSNIPGYGSEGLLPSFLPSAAGGVSPEGKELRNKISSLSSEVIKLYSGTAAGEKEVRRIAEGIGSNTTQTDKELRDGLIFLRDKIRAKKKAIDAGYNDEVRSIYKSRDGLLAEDFDPLSFGRGKKKATTDAPPVGAKATVNGKEVTFQGGDFKDPSTWK